MTMKNLTGKFCFFAFALLIILTACNEKGTGHTPKNWQWRGENRDGAYNETGLLKVWPTEGPQLLWKYEGLGEGFTSAAIANGKIYITGITDDRLILYVFDLQGQLLTKKDVGQEWTKNHVGTRCSVDINDGKLYIGNSLGQLFCLDETTLNEIWKRDGIAEFGGRNIMFGMTENPLIVDDKVFMTPGGEEHGIVALNKNTGALIWSSPGVGTPSSYSSPQYIGDQSVPMVITYLSGPQQPGRVHDNTLMALNANTGEMLWQHEERSGNPITPNTPLYYKGMILSITGYGGGAWQYRLKDGGKTAELVWHNSEIDNQMGGVVKIGDYLYAGGHNNNNWFCVDWKTGETKYKVRDIGRGITITADGMLYVYSERDGTMNLVKPNPDKFELVSSFKVTMGTGPHWAHPIIHNGVLYLRHGDALMAYKIK